MVQVAIGPRRSLTDCGACDARKSSMRSYLTSSDTGSYRNCSQRGCIRIPPLPIERPALAFAETGLLALGHECCATRRLGHDDDRGNSDGDDEDAAEYVDHDDVEPTIRAAVGSRLRCMAER